ncbi:hypothetical protein ZOSMA_36G00160 [Zostera marina]|uniref:Bifunctional inhibitor/plant lipid transfer protein/seed storage helical domain-containing protein n=1 Tax=Zostera marina TaxID=29655 RepID=A0A0K9P5X3_ZOSMR|nr:hypothetical protein ZOSMA_36G00160 [Zostera marina]
MGLGLRLALTAAMAAMLMVYASADLPDCNSVIIPLAPCLPFVTGAAPTPSINCCTAFASVVSSNPRCLCTVLDGDGSKYGVSINRKIALTLPASCNVVTPPPEECNN